MPRKATSKAQQALMAIALNSPSKVRKKNRGVLKMSEEELRGFAETPTKGMQEHVAGLMSKGKLKKKKKKP